MDGVRAGSEIEISFIDQRVKCPFLKVWGKTVKVTKSQGAKRKFTQINIKVTSISYQYCIQNHLNHV
ncbi:hypothetical protein Hanom_Chr14g01269531 [Helianthus anomalus]